MSGPADGPSPGAPRCDGASPEGAARVAVYWAPRLDDPLHALGSAWLGRDAEGGAMPAQPRVAGLDLAGITADARRYGLHATLKAPFRLAGGYDALRRAALELAAGTAPFALPPLELADLGGFLALRESLPCPALHALADACVERLDRFRAALTEAELARRDPARLDPRRRVYLERWGYPEVFGAWRFHVTLSRRLTGAERAAVRPALARHLGGAPALPRRVSELCLFTQRAPDAPFRLAERLPLLG